MKCRCRNNSGISDFPIPFHANVLGSYEDVVNLDRLALRANQNLLIDIPNGTGFCLYITRPCLSAVGHLAETFERGYLEDVHDFTCARARKRFPQRLRTLRLCRPRRDRVPSAKPNAGAGPEEPSLSSIIAFRPFAGNHRRLVVKADPLRPARTNIERLLPALVAEERRVKVSEVPLPKVRKIDFKRVEPGNVLAVIPTRTSAAEFTLLRGLAAALFSSQPQLDVVVAGATFDDRRLMSHPNVFVSGSIEAHELDRVLSTVCAGRVLILDLDAADLSHPAFVLAHTTGLPIAYIEWSRGTVAVRSGDLAILPGMPSAWMIERISAWVKGSIIIGAVATPRTNRAPA